MSRAQEEWARCRGWIAAAVEPTGLYEIGDVEAAIADGAMQFWPGRDCAAVTEFALFPNCKALNVFAGGGVRGRALKELVTEMEPRFVAFARAADCKKIMGFGIYESWKSVGLRLGYRHVWTVMAKDID